MEPPINPVCDKDFVPMSLMDLYIEGPSDPHFLRAHACDQRGCHRCYNDATGYFDLLAERIVLGAEQNLCLGDAHAMLLEHIDMSGQ